jgi:hypothetical protein
MSPALEDDLREALRVATAPVTVPPGLADRARLAVRRRHARRSRAALLLAPVAVVVVVAAAVLVLPRVGGGPAPVPTADEELLNRPTGGDLAGDAAVEATVVEAFLRGVRPPTYRSPDLPTPLAGAGPIGDPHVLWIGTTPGGPAAVVVQRERGPAGSVVAVGFVGPGRTGPTLAAVGRGAPGYDDLAGAFLGTDRRTVLVVDRGEPLTWSYQHTYRPGGGIVLRDRRVVFTDGVAVLRVPAGVDPGQVAVTRPGAPGPDRVVALGNYEYPAGGGVAARLPWAADKQDPDAGLFPVGGGDERWPAAGSDDRYGQLLETFRAALEAVPSDRGLVGDAGDDLWYAYGSTPDGRRLVATDEAALGDASRAYAVLVRDGAPPVVVDGGPVTPRSAVPFVVRLPDAQGWLVASRGKALSWRTGTGAWTAAGRDAALLPAAATEVRGGSTAVPLG